MTIPTGRLIITITAEPTASLEVVMGPFDALPPIWVTPLVVALSGLFVYSRRWWIRRDRRVIPAKWWPIGFEPGQGSTGSAGAPGTRKSDLPTLPRQLAAVELSFLAGNRNDCHLLALGFTELGARRVLTIKDDWVSLTNEPRPHDMPLLQDLICEVCDQELDDRVSATAGDLGTHLVGDFLRDRDLALDWVGAPLVSIGLMDVRVIDEHHARKWSPTPAGQAWVDWAAGIAANTDQAQLAEMAKTDPVSALRMLEQLPPSLMILMRGLHPIAHTVAVAAEARGLPNATVNGIHLSDLNEVDVLLLGLRDGEDFG